jgi:hypothetical protein
VLCLGMHSNVMLRFMVQALQDLPLCSSTVRSCALVNVRLSRAYMAVARKVQGVKTLRFLPESRHGNIES